MVRCVLRNGVGVAGSGWVWGGRGRVRMGRLGLIFHSRATITNLNANQKQEAEILKQSRSQYGQRCTSIMTKPRVSHRNWVGGDSTCIIVLEITPS